MMKREFEERIGREISAGDYKIVELVYNWHPSIPNEGGKDTIAQLYLIGGMGVIRDMGVTASERCANVNRMQAVIAEVREEMQEVEAEIAEAESKVKSLRAKWEELRVQRQAAVDNLRAYEATA